MAVEIAGIALDRIHRIRTLEQNHCVHQNVPGMQGNVIQTMGRESIRLQLEGIFYGAKARDELEKLRKVYSQQEPVDFLADIVGQAYFSQVILERFEVQQSAEDPDQFSYVLTIAESVNDPAMTTTNVDAGVEVNAKELMTAMTLPDVLNMGTIPEISNPVISLKTALEPIKETMQTLDEALGQFKTLFRA
ncbi:MAG: DNA circularization N-terminal domain-containing protein [Plectolyngbya sp. WJT66-NPBG17]|jgi:hypothetical protein|nr:DNA circularization N-terminal domain-containing protein [Plectolyngbya sp. WJT66-NPBG17]MBW4528270.1 DNA circularization N-terminal domain-containing protein [Phormidium tanganyikae FI6-MK23]